MPFKGFLLLAMSGVLGAGITALIMWLRFYTNRARMKRIFRPVQDVIKVWPCPGDTVVIYTREKIPEDEFKILVNAIGEFVEHDQFTVLNLLNNQSIEKMSKENLEELVVQKHVNEEVGLKHQTLATSKCDDERKKSKWTLYEDGVMANHCDGRMIEQLKIKENRAIQYKTHVRTGAGGISGTVELAKNYTGDKFITYGSWHHNEQTWWHPETGAFIKIGPVVNNNRQYRLYRNGKTHDYNRFTFAARDGQLDTSHMA